MATLRPLISFPNLQEHYVVLAQVAKVRSMLLIAVFPLTSTGLHISSAGTETEGQMPNGHKEAARR
ncbi:MAG: hypothetical protein RMI91_02180 [Gemmatales bacterium]|nr:hypothetical protein [Gemmatales bacterium]MDW7993435.1 hypothetical protein [Gemmatales bacterium]